MDWRANWIYIVIAGFGVGVFYHSLFSAEGYASFATIGFVVLLALTAALVYVLRRDKRVFVAALLLIGVSIGLVRFDIAALDRGDPYLEQRLEQEVVLEGVVLDEPDRRETNTKLTVATEYADDTEAKAKVLVVAEPFQRYAYGDRVQVVGKISKPEGFIGDDGRYFDYAAYLGKDDIFYQMLYPEVEIAGHGEGNFVKRALFTLKDAFLGNVAKVVPEPHSSLLGGLVVGAKQSLGEGLLEQFQRTGIIHIVVLSGYNISIVVEFIKRMLAVLGGRITSIASVITIALFVIMTGASSTAIRAGTMAVLVILARSTGRTYDIIRGLILAGFLMVMVNPKILVFDVSFQLSFMATLGLIYLAPKFEQYLKWLPSTGMFQFREFASATIATQLFVLPILLAAMGEVSLVSLPVNLLVLGVIPITMFAGFVTGMVGFLGTALSLPFGLITSALLSYQLVIVDWFSRLPFAAVSVPPIPWWLVIAVYLAAVAVMIVEAKRKKR